MSNSIDRQYFSPNCILSLQGFTDDNGEDNSSQVMSVLTLAKCQIMSTPPAILQGGLTLLENLTQVVSSYTQSLLSGLNHPVDNTHVDSHYLELKKIDNKNRHLLVWQEEKDNPEAQKLEIELSTIQLFDLQDAIDQFTQDNQTLPQIKDELTPLSRRYRMSEVSVVEQTTPAALGFVSVCLAGLLLFFIPHPQEINDPNLEPQPINNEVEEEEEVEVIPPSEN